MFCISWQAFGDPEAHPRWSLIPFREHLDPFYICSSSWEPRAAVQGASWLPARRGVRSRAMAAAYEDDKINWEKYMELIKAPGGTETCLGIRISESMEPVHHAVGIGAGIPYASFCHSRAEPAFLSLVQDVFPSVQF